MAKKSYTRRADGRYQRDVKIYDQNGIERKKRVYARSLNELEAKVQQVREDNKRGMYKDPDITVSRYTERWLKYIEGKCADNTYMSYKYSVQHICDKIGAIQLRRLNKQDIQTAVDSFGDQPRTAQIFRMTTNRICESAIDDLIISRNPCRGVLLPSYKAKEKRALTQLELDAIEAADLDTEERLFISLLFYCGLRRGEALAIGRADIDLKRGLLTVNHSLSFPDNKGILKEPKTQTSRRTVPIPAELKDQLAAFKYDMYLFTRRGDFFTLSAYTKMWTRIIEKLNVATRKGNAAAGQIKSIDPIKGLTAHIFRHNYASLLYKQGIDVKTAQKLLGHSSIAVTMDIYTHLEELDAATINAIESAFTARCA